MSVGVIYGVGGVGKSALAYRLAGGWRKPVVYRRVAESDGQVAVIGDVRRALAGDTLADPRATSLEALAAAIDAADALVLVDDLHLLPPSDAAQLVHELGRTLARGRLLVTSRERIPRGDGPDRVDIHLDSLDRNTAAELWCALDALYGPTTGFEAAFDASTGNPLVLRRWHAGELLDDPVADLVRTLTPDARHIASLLALAAVRLPAAVVSETLPDGQRVVASLVRKMIVESDPTGLSIHDLFRPLLERALGTDEAHALHRRLATIVSSLDIDPVVKGRHVVRHLGAAGAWDEVGRYLLDIGSQFIRIGGARDLLRAFDTIPPQRRSRAVAIARARTLSRAGSLQQACDELERLRDDTPDPELELALAQAAMLVGQLDTAQVAVDRALGQPLTDTQLVRAHTTRAIILTHCGRGDEARAFLAAAERAEASSKHRAHLALTGAFTLFLDEQLGAGEAEALIERARMLYEHGAKAYQASALAIPLVAAVLAHEGHVDAARTALDRTELLLERIEDALLTDIQFLRATTWFDAGQRLEALRELVAVEHAFLARGNVLGVRFAQVWRARVLLVLGRLDEARALLADVAKVAAMLPSVGRAVERSRLYDSTSWCDDTPPALALRRRLRAAFEAAAAGDRGRVQQQLRGMQARCAGPGYALDRALLHLVRARLAAALGDSVAAARERRRAEAEAGDEADLGAVAQLAFAAGLTSETDPKPIVLDLEVGALRWGKQSLQLGQRPALRQLLYLLAGAGTVDKTTLARTLWGMAYKPSTHDNALWVNMARLRKLVAPAGLTVQTRDDGYRLVAPARLLVVGTARTK